MELYRRTKAVTVKGRDCPDPILKFNEAAFPSKSSVHWNQSEMMCGPVKTVSN